MIKIYDVTGRQTEIPFEQIAQYNVLVLRFRRHEGCVKEEIFIYFIFYPEMPTSYIVKTHIFLNYEVPISFAYGFPESSLFPEQLFH